MAETILRSKFGNVYITQNNDNHDDARAFISIVIMDKPAQMAYYVQTYENDMIRIESFDLSKKVYEGRKLIAECELIDLNISRKRSLVCDETYDRYEILMYDPAQNVNLKLCLDAEFNTSILGKVEVGD
jgi:hypothetical protein